MGLILVLVNCHYKAWNEEFVLLVYIGKLTGGFLFKKQNKTYFSTVAIQCLETVFKINLEDSHLAVPIRLTEMFEDSCHKVRLYWSRYVYNLNNFNRAQFFCFFRRF